jgi:hypothetical protein
MYAFIKKNLLLIGAVACLYPFGGTDFGSFMLFEC